MPKLMMRKRGLSEEQIEDLAYYANARASKKLFDECTFYTHAMDSSKNYAILDATVLFSLASVENGVLMEGNFSIEHMFPKFRANILTFNFDGPRNKFDNERAILFYDNLNYHRKIWADDVEILNDVIFTIDRPQLTYVFEKWQFWIVDNA